jgi:hypothetical protein
MQALRKNLCWVFVLTSIICAGIVVQSVLEEINRYYASPPLLTLLVPTLFSVLAIVFGLAWWTIWKVRPSARGWGIAASLINVLVSLVPLALSSHTVWRCSGATLPIGIAGLIAYTRRCEEPPFAANDSGAVRAPAKRKGLGSIAALLACAAVICGIAVSWVAFRQKATQQHLAEAATACRMSAEKGDMASQSALGTKYLRGEGVRQDYIEAVRWYRRAADQGYAKGEFNLGYVYARGYGVSQDYAEAARWYRKAADQGDAFAQYNLGLSYSLGQGVPQDSGEADRWFQKAADQGDEYAKRALGRENASPNALSMLLPLVILVGSLVLLTGDSKRVWGFQNWRKSTVLMSIGILGILYAGLSFCEIARSPMRNSLYAGNAFYFAKGALIGMSCVLALSISARNFDPEEPESCVEDVEATETTEEDEKSDSF